MLSDGEGNNEFQGAMESVVKDIISKESMYEPMRKLREAYPEWLEKNWQTLSDEELEKYNKQLDKVTEICAAFELEAADGQPEINKEKIFEMLNEL
jgi:peroxin-19